jgi:heptosyltransferase III
LNYAETTERFYPISIMTALIYHTGALGDFLTATPVLRYWKLQNGPLRLVLLGNPSIGAFAIDAGVIDDYLDIDEPAFLPLFSGTFSSEVNKIMSPFLAAILFAAPGSPVIDNVKQCGISRLYCQPPFPSSRLHAVDYHLSLFTDPSTLPPETKRPRITPSSASIKESFSIIPDKCCPAALHPGSGSRKKNWPFERFVSLADAVRKKGIPVMWLFGPADDGFNVPSGDIVVLNRPLALCAALLSRCRAFIGNDSGMAHLAAAVDCPSVVLFGPSDPMVWAPRGRNVRIIYKNRSCSPCHRSPFAPLSCDNGCMTGIAVEEVLDAIRGSISPARAGRAGRRFARRRGRSYRQDSR